MAQFQKVGMSLFRYRSVSSIAVAVSRQPSCRWSKITPRLPPYYSWRSKSSFKVRLITDEHDLKSYFVNTLASEKRRPGLGDVNSLLACDPTGLFVGELNGKPVCTLALLKYDSSFTFMSCYIMEKEYRGQGYGMELFKKAFKSVPPAANLIGYSEDEMLPNYRETLGGTDQWITPRYNIDLPTAFQILSKLALNDVCQVQTIDEVDMQALFNYDTSVFGYQRQTFLQTFLRAQGSHVRVAISQEGVIVGYTAARVAFNKEEGYRLGPLYADSLEIAQVLLKALFEEVLAKGMSSSPSIWVDIPVGKNAEAKTLSELLEGKLIVKISLITTKGIPKGRFEKWFAITSSALG